MKTIEERAKEKSKIYCRQYRHNASWLGEDFVYSNEEIELACKEIATEQKQLDIDKACEWLKEHAIEYNGNTGFDEPTIDIDDFRKAMEE